MMVSALPIILYVGAGVPDGPSSSFAKARLEDK